MKAGVQLKYGKLSGPDWGFAILMTDSEVLSAQSGRFLFRNATTGLGEVADTTDVIIGFTQEVIASTSTSTVKCLHSLDAIVRIPLVYDNSSYTVNYAATLMFETCDFYVASDIQYADPTNASTDQIIIVGGKAATGTDIVSNDGYLDVIINPRARQNIAVGA